MAHHIHLNTTHTHLLLMGLCLLLLLLVVLLLLLLLSGLFLLLLLLLGAAPLHQTSPIFPCCSCGGHCSGSTHSSAIHHSCCCTDTTSQGVVNAGRWGQWRGVGRGVSWRLHACADARHVTQLQQRHDLAVEATQVVDHALHTGHTQHAQQLRGGGSHSKHVVACVSAEHV
jgi:hypothetical protein